MLTQRAAEIWYSVQILEGFGHSDPEVRDEYYFDSEDAAEDFASELDEDYIANRVVKVVDGIYFLCRFGKWVREN